MCRSHLLPRHNLVRDALFDLMVKMRFFRVKNVPVTCLGFRSGHVTPCVQRLSGVDVTIMSPLVTNNQPQVDDFPGLVEKG